MTKHANQMYWLPALALLLLLNSPARAEMYVAGQVGVTLPQSLSNVEWSALGTTLNGNDLSLHNSVMYGAKLGYYFDSLKWLGLETEVFNTTPNLKQQNFIVGGINLGTAPGVDFRVLTWAPVNIVVRWQLGAFEPYHACRRAATQVAARISDSTPNSD
jgi:hypothetical protein